jgi:hypothetical protein
LGFLLYIVEKIVKKVEKISKKGVKKVAQGLGFMVK